MSAFFDTLRLAIRWVSVLTVIALVAIVVLIYFVVRGRATALEAAILLSALYFLPSLVAWHRRSSLRLASYVVNLLFGWTILGWIAAWIAAMSESEGF